jgi:hypothetical protein
MPIDCNHISMTREWLNPPAIYSHRDEIHYVSKKYDDHDIPQDEIDEWLSGFDAKEFPKQVAVEIADEPVSTAVIPMHESITAAASSLQEESLEQRFASEADKWERETSHLSSTPKMVLHSSYQRILAMGPDVVPYLLLDLQRTHRSWFWALNHLTGVDPVRIEDKGDLDKMVAAWVAWGKREGKI